MKKFFKRGNRGFTLIELLVVIAILGTLAAVVILNVTKYITAGQSEGQATEKANVQTAVAAYMYDHTGTVPTGPFTAGTNGGNLSPFLLSNLNCTYTLDGTGAIASQSGCLK
jgi:type IV pilus assembly protein PilA